MKIQLGFLDTIAGCLVAGSVLYLVIAATIKHDFAGLAFQKMFFGFANRATRDEGEAHDGYNTSSSKANMEVSDDTSRSRPLGFREAILCWC